jgi:hypothetical protein
VKEFLLALCEKKKIRQHIVSAVLESIVGENVKADVELTIYNSFQDKFAPWKCLLHLDLECLLHLDLETSVSLQGLKII